MKRDSDSTPRKTEILRGRVPATMKEKVLDHAAAKQTSEAQIVRIAVSEWLRRNGKGNAKTA